MPSSRASFTASTRPLSGSTASRPNDEGTPSLAQIRFAPTQGLGWNDLVHRVFVGREATHDRMFNVMLAPKHAFTVKRCSDGGIGGSWITQESQMGCNDHR